MSDKYTFYAIPMTLKPKRLVILSIPFQRLIRSYLSPCFLRGILSESNLLIVSPFSKEKHFCSKFAHENIAHADLSHFSVGAKYKFFENLIKILRLHGYWWKNSAYFQYYIKNRAKKFRDNGDDYQVPAFLRILITIVGILGSIDKFWRIFWRLFLYREHQLDDVIRQARHHDEVVLITTSSWSMRDCALINHPLAKQWKKIFVPYTTDQLFCNGYLFGAYDFICVKGALEKFYAEKLHGIDQKKIVMIGSLDFRVIDQYITNKASLSTRSIDRAKKIIYAGSTRKYYPIDQELAAIDKIITERGRKLPRSLFITYRAFYEDRKSQEELLMRFSGVENFNVEFVSSALVGLEKYEFESVDEIYKNQIEEMLKFDLMIMSGYTSLALDAAYLGVPSISFWSEKSQMLKKRNIETMFDGARRRKFIYQEIPTAFSLSELIDLADALLSSEESSKKICESTVASWDFKEANYEYILNKIIVGKSSC